MGVSEAVASGFMGAGKAEETFLLPFGSFSVPDEVVNRVTSLMAHFLLPFGSFRLKRQRT